MTHPLRIALLSGIAVLAGLAGASGPAPAAAQVAPLACIAGVDKNCGRIELVQADCGSAAARVARQHGGEVIGAPQTVTRGGQTMCVVTILIRDPSGQRPPMRKQVTVPAG